MLCRKTKDPFVRPRRSGAIHDEHDFASSGGLPFQTQDGGMEVPYLIGDPEHDSDPVGGSHLSSVWRR
jgi:hypothetical protein